MGSYMTTEKQLLASLVTITLVGYLYIYSIKRVDTSLDVVLIVGNCF